ncbi:hypothetical protein D9758_009688 [Tetrapyrgos nigripes]|uniref:TPR-like protein n=1 Tax=Tetrapyrgos nigripes TaxID=182062 RepID=A0A8H5CNR1_9AGAR|nr:hypothetical protein D9758_009688 [Tetrapyrgos nigripes]
MSLLCGCWRWHKNSEFSRGEEHVGTVSTAQRKDELGPPSKSEMAADALLSTLEIVAETIPFPAVGTAVKAAVRLIEICQQVRESFEQADELKERVRGLSLVLVQGLSGKPVEEITDSLKRDIEQLQGDLHYIEEKLTDISKQHRILVILFKNANEEAVQKCLKRLDGSLSSFELSRQVQNATDLKKLESDIETYYKTLQATWENTEEMKRSIEEIKAILRNYNPEFRQEIKSTSRKPRFPPRSRIFYGRDELVYDLAKKLVPALNDTEQVFLALLGTGGMGKTSAALAVVEHQLVLERYGGSQTLDDILTELEPPSGKPALQPYRLLLLDNFETPWHLDSQREVEKLLLELMNISRLSIVITMRANQPPTDQKWEIELIKPVDADASARIYTEIYPKTSTKGLYELLDTVGHLPLAITLLAKYASTNQATPTRLLRDWRLEGPDVLTTTDDGADNMINKSIALSIDKPPMNKSTDALSLLNLLAFFPAPLPHEHLAEYWVPETINQLKAVSVLSKTALVELTDATVFVIPVVRSYIIRRTPQPDLVATRAHIHRVCCSLLALHKSSPGDDSYIADKAFISSQEVNFRCILLDATSEPIANVSPEILEALLTLSWHQCWTRPRLDLVEHTLSVAKKALNAKYEAESQACSAEMYFLLNQFDHAIERVSLAHSQFISLQDRRSAAGCTIRLIEYMMYKGDDMEVLSLADRARTEYGADDVLGQAMCTLFVGQIYWGEQEGLKARTHLEQAKVQFEQLGSRLELGRCLFFLARTYQEHPALALDSLSIALRLANEALDIFRQHGREEYITQCLTALATILKEDKQYSAALRTALQALDSAKSLGDSNGVSQALCQNGDILFRMGDYEGAQDALRKSLIALEGMADSFTKTRNKDRCNKVLAMIEEQSRSTYCEEDEEEEDGMGPCVERRFPGGTHLVAFPGL